MSDETQRNIIYAQAATISGLQRAFQDSEMRRQLAQGKADTYLRELKEVRKARERGRRANFKLREERDTARADAAQEQSIWDGGN